MRKGISIALLFFLFSMICQAQGLYSRQNLEKVSEEELSLLLTKAEKQKKVGGIITAGGTAVFLTGAILIATNREAAAYTGFYMSIVGLGVTIIGLPTLISGSSKVKTISNVWNTRYNSAFIDIAPSGIYNYQTHNIQPGLSLTVRF